MAYTTEEQPQDPMEAIQVELLGFCSCGRPEENLLYIYKGLSLINEEGPIDKDKHREWFADYSDRANKHFGSQEAAYFFYYWADKEGFTEHGGSVPGWLTTKGEHLLKLLSDYATNKDHMKEFDDAN